MAVKFIEYEGFEYKLSYDLLHPHNKKMILFLHGWGSNKELMQTAFQNSFTHYAHLYLDMPGFGKSNHHAPLTTKDYAAIVTLVLEAFDYKKEMIFGHSFGGKVATLLNPQTLVLLSTAGIVEKKPLKIRAKIALFKLFKPLGAAKFRSLFVSDDAKGMDSAMYQTFKNVVDEDFTSFFQNYRGNCFIFWGRDDRATSLQSGQKIAQLITNSRLHTFGGDHYFFLHHAKQIEKLIQDV
ncbi:MAG: alpha/beta fold hydrolase [Campylobacterota bacterium]